MNTEDIPLVIEQENAIEFDSFDADRALQIGLSLKDLAAADGKAVAIDVRLWDRQLFMFAMQGTTADNQEWVRRKINGVKRYQKCSYRMVLERGGLEAYKPLWGFDQKEIVFAGGCFPIKIAGVGSCIGAVTVSGLPQREDHNLVIKALCLNLGLDHDKIALPPE